MTVHFICRGNAFRSLIAEAYLKSLAIDGVTVMSSGTMADEYRDFNKDNYQQTLDLLRRHGIVQFAKTHYADKLTPERLIDTDIAICINELVAQECSTQELKLPANTQVWDVADIGEKHRQVSETVGREAYLDEVYDEIAAAVDELAKSLRT